MKTKVSPSSIATYHDLKYKALGDRQRLILEAMKPGRTYSRRQIARKTKLETSCVAGRVNELIAAEIIVVVGQIKCPITHRTVEAIALAEAKPEVH